MGCTQCGPCSCADAQAWTRLSPLDEPPAAIQLAGVAEWLAVCPHPCACAAPLALHNSVAIVCLELGGGCWRWWAASVREGQAFGVRVGGCAR